MLTGQVKDKGDEGLLLSRSLFSLFNGTTG